METKEQKKAGVFQKFLYEVFIDGLSGMATGLFATLIMGTIIVQISSLVGTIDGLWAKEIENYLFLIGKVASVLTGAGIGD